MKFKDGIYDLTPMKGKIYLTKNVKEPTNQQIYDYEINICENFIKNCGLSKYSSVCQEWDGSNSANIGLFRKIEEIRNGLRFYSDNGDPVNGVPRNAMIDVFCDKSEDGVKLMAFQNIIGTLSFIGNATSKYACGSGIPYRFSRICVAYDVDGCGVKGDCCIAQLNDLSGKCVSNVGVFQMDKVNGGTWIQVKFDSNGANCLGHRVKMISRTPYKDGENDYSNESVMMVESMKNVTMSVNFTLINKV